MKKFGLIALLMLFATTSALACGGPDKAQHMAKKLGLDDTQTEQVMVILKEQHSKMRESYQSLRDQGIEPRSEAASAQRAALHEETRQRLGSVLSGEQLAAFDEMHERKRQHKREHRMKHKAEKEGAAI